MDEMNEQDYNQVKANATGETYYLVQAGDWCCKLWAETPCDAAHICYTFWPKLLGTFLTITAITQPTKTENGGN